MNGSYDWCIERAQQARALGWKVERIDLPEEGRVIWKMWNANGLSTWQFLRFGRVLETEAYFHPDWEDFWACFEQTPPELVEPYSKLHPSVFGFVNYAAANVGVACIHLVEKIVPSPTQIGRMLEVWRTLEDRANVRQ